MFRYYPDIKQTYIMDYLYDRAKLSERRENRHLRSFNALYQYYRLNVNISKRCTRRDRSFSISSIRHVVSQTSQSITVHEALLPSLSFSSEEIPIQGLCPSRSTLKVRGKVGRTRAFLKVSSPRFIPFVFNLSLLVYKSELFFRFVKYRKIIFMSFYNIN